MVFPGRFSTGCKRCRQRKVKCDEGQPSCRRCQIYGKPCPGYADQFHFRFDKTASKQANPSRPQPRREKSQAPCQLEEPLPSQRAKDDQTLVQTTGNVKPLTIMPQLGVSYDDVSLGYFVSRFVTPDEDDSLPGHLSFLPSLYKQYTHGVLELATLSVAQMAAYNQFGGNRLRLQSYQNYGHALRALQTTIQTEEVTDDRVLAAVLLLCMFKEIGEEGYGDPSEHAPGLYYLLERRGVEQLYTNRGFELFLLALIKLQTYSFLHNDNRYSDPGGLIAWLSLYDPMMRGMSLMTKTMWLRQNLLKCSTRLAKENESKETPSQSDTQESSDETDQSTLCACFEALGEFDTWDTDAELYWKNTFDGRCFPATLGEPPNAASYCDPKTACILILVRCARLVLLLSILEYYDAIRVPRSNNGARRVGDRTAWANCIPILEQNIRLTIDDMLYCVPFALGDLGPDGAPVSIHQDGAAALVVVQPMKLVTYCVYATAEQRKSSQDILNRMKTAIGVRSAVSWEEQAASIASVPHKPFGAQSLIRAMSSLSTSGAGP